MYASVDIMNPNFRLVAQDKCTGCPGDMCNGDEIPEGYSSILIHKVWVQNVKLQYSQPRGNPPHVRMKDAPILWKKNKFKSS